MKAMFFMREPQENQINDALAQIGRRIANEKKSSKHQAAESPNETVENILELLDGATYFEVESILKEVLLRIKHSSRFFNKE